ncbi:MAG: ice-binding family protein [Thermoplasmataceae archaeon]
MYNHKNKHIIIMLAVLVSITFILSSSMFSMGQSLVNSSPDTHFVNIAVPNYTVTFNETGLTPGTQWNVTLNGTYMVSNTSSLNFSLPTGNYTFTINSVPGFSALPASGSIAVNNSNTSENINFTKLSAVSLAPVNLGTAGNFAILAKTGISTTGTTKIIGNIGVSPAAASYITGFALTMNSTNQFSTSSLVTGDVYASDYAAPTPSYLTTAVGDMQAAYVNAAGRTDPGYVNLGAGNVNGMTLVPGLYKWSTGLYLSTSVTLSGNASSVWIFQISGKLTVTTGAKIILSGGALPQNIFWQVAGGATIGTGVVFNGVILSQTLITLDTGTSMNGNALAQTAVTLDANAVTKPNVTVTSTPVYNITFAETGLAPGTMWNVTLNGTKTSSVNATDNFTVFNGIYAFTIESIAGYKVSPSTGNVTVNGANAIQTITFTLPNKTAYNITFTETGLSAGKEWNVTLSNATKTVTKSSVNTTDKFTEINGTYKFTVPSIVGYKVLPSTGNVTVNGTNAYQAITFALSNVATYNVTFNETGLSSGTQWNVTLNGTTTSSVTSSIVFIEINGTYTYNVGLVPLYKAVPSSGNITVSGKAVNTTIIFMKTSFNAVFKETGLSTGIQWNVTLNGTKESSVTGSIVFTEINGTYNFITSAGPLYKAVPSSGNITVSGKAVNTTIIFSLVTFNVTFTEKGLPSGKQWNVTLNKVLMTSVKSTINFSVFNGTYAFTVGSLFGYKIFPSTGKVTVNGANAFQAITFAKPTQSVYEIFFNETGLSSGTQWNVTLNGTTTSSVTSSIVFIEINGTYTYNIDNVTGYKLSVTTGTIIIAGNDFTQNVTFTPVTPPASSSSSLLPYIILGIVIAAVAIGAAAVMIMRKK